MSQTLRIPAPRHGLQEQEAPKLQVVPPGPVNSSLTEPKVAESALDPEEQRRLDFLLSKASDTSSSGRAYAASSLKVGSGPAARGALVRLADEDDDWNVRWVSVTNLGQSADDPQIREVLQRRLADPDPLVQRAAIEALRPHMQGLPEPVGYPFRRDQHQNWGDIKNGRVQPTPAQAAVIAAVERGLDKGIFYQAHLYDHVISELKGSLVTEQDLDRQPATKVERGMFGMEIYYARGVVEARREAAENLAALATIKVGDQIKNRSVGGMKLSTLTAASLDQENGRVNFSATRRGLKGLWEGSMEARYWIKPPDPLFKVVVQTITKG